MKKSAAELSELVDGTLEGSGNLELTGVRSLEAAAQPT